MQTLANGLIVGAAIAILALAFQVVYLPTRVFFVGLGGVYSLAPFVADAVLHAGAGWPAAILAAVVLCAGASVLAEWANHARLARKGASDGTQFVSSLGIYILLVQLIAMIWGNDSRALRTGLHAISHLAGLVLTRAQVQTIGVAMVLVVGFAFFLNGTGLGLRLRALAENPAEFALLGYNVNRHRLIAFSIAGFLAAAISLVVSYDLGFDPHIGLDSLLLAIVAVIIGGRDSFWGPALAGVLLGIVRAEVVWLAGVRWQDAATFALLIFFLFLRPQGILGRGIRLEAQP
jgi:branched-chain amino acid transport system permease protein